VARGGSYGIKGKIAGAAFASRWPLRSGGS
jgi:hypothetical protein